MNNFISLNDKIGRLEVICGPMFSGKSEELIRRMRRAKIAQQTVVAFKNRLDTQHDHAVEYVISHNGTKISAQPTETVQEILCIAEQENAQVICIDNVHFFSQKIIQTICALVAKGNQVIVAGLDLDFRGVPFGPIPTLLALANQITKLHAICSQCGNEASFTQRFINGKSAQYDDPILMIGAQETYQARCRRCYTIDKTAPFMAIDPYEQKQNNL